MIERGSRLREARARAGFRDATAAARRFGWRVSTYLAHENSSRGYSIERAEVYAAAFKANPAWLLTGHGPPSGASTPVPISGYVGAGGTVFSADSLSDSGPLEQVELPPGPLCAYAVFKARGDRVYPAHRDGELLFARKDAGLPRDCVNRDALSCLTTAARCSGF